MASLSPLLPFLSRKSCEAGTNMLAGLLGEAIGAQETASKRTDDLKQLQPKGLMELFTPEKANGAATTVKASGEGQKEKPQPQRRQLEERGAAAAGGVPVSPRKKAETPKKRARKVSEKAAEVVFVSDEEEEEDEVIKPRKQAKNLEKKKQSVKRGQGMWSGEEYPRIAAVIGCNDDGADGGLRVEVHAKKSGRGQWQKMLFSLDSAQLDSIDDLPEKTKHLVKGSFHKALTRMYGQKWPYALRLALAGTAWAKDMLPALAEGGELEGDFAGLVDPNANMNFSDV